MGQNGYRILWLFFTLPFLSLASEFKPSVQINAAPIVNFAVKPTESVADLASSGSLSSYASIFPPPQNNSGGFMPILPGHDAQPELKTITITKNVPVPYPVTVEKVVPYKVEVPIDRPIPIYISKPYNEFMGKKMVQLPLRGPHRIEPHHPVPMRSQMEKPFPMAIPRHYPFYIFPKKVPYITQRHLPFPFMMDSGRPMYPPIQIKTQPVIFPVQVKVERHFPVPVEKRIPILVEKPVPFPIEKIIPVPVKVPVHVPIKVPVPVLVYAQHSSQHPPIGNGPKDMVLAGTSIHHHQFPGHGRPQGGYSKAVIEHQRFEFDEPEEIKSSSKYTRSVRTHESLNPYENNQYKFDYDDDYQTDEDDEEYETIRSNSRGREKTQIRYWPAYSNSIHHVTKRNCVYLERD